MKNNKILYATKRVVAAVMLSALLFSTSEIGVLAETQSGQEDIVADEDVQLEEEKQVEEQPNSQEDTEEDGQE